MATDDLQAPVQPTAPAPPKPEDWFGTGSVQARIEVPTVEDKQTLRQLTKARIGTGLNIDETVRDTVDPGTPGVGGFAAYAPDGSVVGFGNASVWGAEHFPHEYMNDVLSDMELPSRVSVWEFVAVHEAWAGRGLASRLRDRCLEYARGMGAGWVVGVSWQREDEVDSTALFESANFSLLSEEPDFYADARDYCPDCGSGGCGCAGKLYARRLDRGAPPVPTGGDSGMV